MALGNCLTMSLNGVLAQLVDVEANVGHGLPGIHVVGQTDTAISESIEAVPVSYTHLTLPTKA